MLRDLEDQLAQELEYELEDQYEADREMGREPEWSLPGPVLCHETRL